MLRLHSFLQEIYGYLQLPSAKKMYRNCVIFVSGTAVITVITFSSQNFNENNRNSSIVEENVGEEIYVETKAKVQPANSFADIEIQQILLQDELEMERIISEKEKNSLSTVTQGQDIAQQEEYNQVKEETIALETKISESKEEIPEAEEEITKVAGEVPEVVEALITDNGTAARYNEFMDSITLTEQEKNSLLHLVAAEAGGCDMVGQILVANVVLNRVESGVFPNTVEGVIFQKNQFSPTINGAIWSSTITDSVREAVDRALNGEDFSEGATFFSARARLDYGSMSWFDNNLNWLFKHDGHEFYSLR